MEFVCSIGVARQGSLFPLVPVASVQRQAAEGRAKLCMKLLGQMGKAVFTGQSGDFTTADKVDTLQTAF